MRTTNFKYELLSFDFLMNYFIGKKLIRGYFECGLETKILLKNSAITNLPDYIESRLFNNGSLSTFLNFGMGCVVQPKDKPIGLSLGTNFHQAFIPIINNYITSTGQTIMKKNYLRFVDIRLALLIKLNK